jgi:hypothetical protein
MRQETIYDIMRSLRHEDEANWKENFMREMLGATVLTSYSNATYRIDDVVFNMSPNSTFDMKDGTKISFREYYLSKYKINILNGVQPLLVSNPKPRDIRAGKSRLILLVPELCRATGITDKMRSNFQLMKQMVSFGLNVQKLNSNYNFIVSRLTTLKWHRQSVKIVYSNSQDVFTVQKNARKQWLTTTLIWMGLWLSSKVAPCRKKKYFLVILKR